MEPAHPKPCSFWDGKESSPRPVGSYLEEGRLHWGRGRACLISVGLSSSPPSVLTDAALSSPERAARAIPQRPGEACICPQLGKSPRSREGPDVALGPSSPMVELQAGVQTRSFRSMDGLLGLSSTLYTPFSDKKTEVQREVRQ